MHKSVPFSFISILSGLSIGLSNSFPHGWKLTILSCLCHPQHQVGTQSVPLEDDLSWANTSKKKIACTRNRITRNKFVILIHFLEIRITKFIRNWEKLVAGQQIIYSYVFVLETGKLFLSSINMLFAITERNTSLSFLMCILTHYERGKEA